MIILVCGVTLDLIQLPTYRVNSRRMGLRNVLQVLQELMVSIFDAFSVHPSNNHFKNLIAFISG